MKFKFNWGTGIFIFIVIFLLAGFGVIYLAYNQKINLVSEDYYPKGINYQEIINKKANVGIYGKQIKIDQKYNSISFRFPDSIKANDVKGSIYLYRPSNNHADKHYKIQLNDSSVQNISSEELLKGKYNVFIEWVANERGYYQENAIIIN